MRVNKRARRNVLSVHVPLCWSVNESLTNKVVRNWFTESSRHIFTDSLKNNLNFRVIRIVELSVARNVTQVFEYWLFLRNIDRSRESPFCFSDDRWRLIFELLFEKKNKSLRVTSCLKFASFGISTISNIDYSRVFPCILCFIYQRTFWNYLYEGGQETAGDILLRN